MWRYSKYLPVQSPANIVTLGEGRTPLCRLTDNLYLKLEQLNPTGSYKDRFASCGISWMKEQGKTRCLATSSGNTGAALAAYCARAGFSCSIFLVETAPEGKTDQMAAHGAHLKRIRGFGISAEITGEVIEALRAGAESSDSALLISAFAHSSAAMAGVKTIAYELADELDEIDDIFVPVGGGGLLTAVYRGFWDLRKEGRILRLPRLHAVQPAGCATVTAPLRRNEEKAVPVSCTSKISGLQVPNVIDGDLALNAVRASEGSGHSVSDEAIYEAQQLLALQGIYAEPAGAASYAGYLQVRDEGRIPPGSQVICLVTGHGFKDPQAIAKLTARARIDTCTLGELLELKGDYENCLRWNHARVEYLLKCADDTAAF